MLEAAFLGGILPSHPDYEPFIQIIRTKYNLREVYPDDDPIEEIYLGDEIISTNKFVQDVKNQFVENMESIFPEDFVKKYKSSKQILSFDYQKEADKFNDELKPGMTLLFESVKNNAQVTYQILDANIDETVKMICSYLLLGDTMEAPADWFGKVTTMKSGEEDVIIALASEITNLDFMFQQIRDLYKKTYHKLPIKITEKTASTAYFLQLSRRHKDTDFILDEFIRLYKFDMPKKNTTRYAEVRKKYWERLKKRLKSANTIVEAFGRENK